MKLQRLLNLTRKAVEEYQMIQDGDRIAVGVFRRKGQSDASLCAVRFKKNFIRSLLRFMPSPWIWAIRGLIFLR